jgi:hypothetical protein
LLSTELMLLGAPGSGKLRCGVGLDLLSRFVMASRGLNVP